MVTTTERVGSKRQWLIPAFAATILYKYTDFVRFSEFHLRNLCLILYNCFIQNFLKKVSPLFSSLHSQKKKGYQFRWNLKVDDAFYNLIEEISDGQ